jgi:hypothetical protein
MPGGAAGTEFAGREEEGGGEEGKEESAHGEKIGISDQTRFSSL